MNKNYPVFQIFVILLLVFLSSCATILDGSRTRVRVINGSPANARVYLNGNYCGEAPATLRVQKKSLKQEGGSKIEIKAEGYETQTVVLTKKTKAGFIVLDLLFGFWPLVIDASTGNFAGVKPKRVRYYLTKEKE